jgi:hypothetical protein
MQSGRGPIRRAGGGLLGQHPRLVVDEGGPRLLNRQCPEAGEPPHQCNQVAGAGGATAVPCEWSVRFEQHPVGG